MRPISVADTDALERIFREPRAMAHYIDLEDPARGWSRTRVEKWVRDCEQDWTERGLGRWAVLEGDMVIGYCGFCDLDYLPDYGRDTEISYRFHPDAWGRGFATEAATAALRYAFATGLDAVVAAIVDGHWASERVAVKLGMRPVAREHYVSPVSGREATFFIWRKEAP